METKDIDISALEIIKYPDKRLFAISELVADPANAFYAALAERMFEIMFNSGGVGLAAAQVGLNIRMFIASPTFSTDDRLVFINPVIIERDGSCESEESCLSFPGAHCKVKRAEFVTVNANDVHGEDFQICGQELAARIFQHEIDHLDGVLLVHKMGTVAKMANKKTLKELEDEFAESRK